MLSPIFESFYQDRSRSGNSDICVNLYAEHTDGPKGPEVGALFSLPGYTLAGTVGTGPVRGAWVANNGVVYVVSGSGFYSVTAGFVSTLLGTLTTATGPVVMRDSPTQVLVIDGLAGWCWSITAATWTQVLPNVTTSDVAPGSMAYQDGFAIVNSGGSNIVYQSNYNDLSTYATSNGAGGYTANDAYVQGNANPVVALFDAWRELWIFKSNATEVWINSGNAGFAFTQLQGVYIPIGCAAPASMVKMPEQCLMWLGADETGDIMVYRSKGYQAAPVSTFALSTLFQGYPVYADAIAYSQQLNGHYFYVITFPTANATYAYDMSSGKWHQRGYIDNEGNLNRERANCYFMLNGNGYIGDFQNGNIYYLDQNNYTENGVARKWVRAWRALTPDMPVGVPMSFDRLQVLLETGITPAPGTTPNIQLRWSDDGGYTWTPYFLMPAGQLGQTAWRVLQNRLGSTRYGSGLDRVWEISSTDPVSVKLTGAEWDGGPA